MPPRVAAPAEVHHGAVVVCGVAGLDNGLTSPKYRARPARGLLGSTFGRDVWDVLKCDDLHDARLHWSRHRRATEPPSGRVGRSLSRSRLLRFARLDVRASCRAALIEFGEAPLRIRVHDVVRLPRFLL